MSQHFTHCRNDITFQNPWAGRSHCGQMHFIGHHQGTINLLDFTGVLDFTQPNHRSDQPWGCVLGNLVRRKPKQPSQQYSGFSTIRRQVMNVAPLFECLDDNRLQVGRRLQRVTTSRRTVLGQGDSIAHPDAVVKTDFISKNAFASVIKVDDRIEPWPADAEKVGKAAVLAKGIDVMSEVDWRIEVAWEQHEAIRQSLAQRLPTLYVGVF
ncbi:hypothetical protein U9R80_12520 [Pseudomonas sp. JQ170C]|nr:MULTISPECIES: hypothetical protein [unclassified Pseudomonas]WRO78896.1 hypothetical protein U9R80_12520 [Pseudomonas sp. 170C]